MIETFKILNGLYDKEACISLKRAIYSKTRGNSMKLYKLPSKNNTRKFFFSVRIVDTWNSLPQHVIDAPSVNAFKTRLDKFWQNQALLTDYRAELTIRTGTI